MKTASSHDNSDCSGEHLRNRKIKGFSLVELMVVMVIIAILASIAIPSYQSSIRRTHRKEAMAALQGLAQSMERFYVQNNSTYEGADTVGVPRFFAGTAPVDGGTPRYNLRITAATATTYTLQAQPIAGTTQEKDGLIQLDSTGLRSWDRDNDTFLENGWEER
jgi:type IV pilus assembly protein PilE